MLLEHTYSVACLVSCHTSSHVFEYSIVMAVANCSSGKRLPSAVMELLDLAVFSFAVQSGLRDTDKVRGDPVIEGVCALFGDMLLCSKEETRNSFNAVSALRLGNWQPWSQPTKEVSQMISSRLQKLKASGDIRKGSPVVPDKTHRTRRGVQRNTRPCGGCE